MIVCPVCDHPQAQGTECDVCGRRLAPGVSAADLAVPLVEGLEPTLQPPVDAPGERIADLEPTLHDPAHDAFAADPTPDLEATRAAPVDVEVDTTPDVERIGDGIPGDAPTVLPAVAICRYCRTPAMPGERSCGRCGMRLPVVADGTAAPATAEPLRICSCGAPVRAGASLCPACGARRW